MTTWTKKNKTTNEGFSGNIKVAEEETVVVKDKKKSPEKKVKFPINDYQQPPSQPEDYNIDVFRKKMMKIEQKRNNYNPKYVLDDINDFILDPTPPEMTPDLSTYIDTDGGISDFEGSFGFDFDSFKNPNYHVGSVPVVEGFKEGMASPLCSSSNTETMNNNKNFVANIINYPFYFGDVILQYLADLTCDMFVHTPPGIVDAVNGNSVDSTKLAADVSNSAGDPTNIVNDSLNDAYKQNVTNNTTVTLDDTGIHFNYKKWQEYVNNKSPDNKIVKRNIECFFMVFLAWYMTYNWYFILFFVDPNGERVKTPTIDDKYLSFNMLLDFFFTPLMTPIIWINRFVMQTFPNFMTATPILKRSVTQFLVLIMGINYFLTTYPGFTQEIINKCIFYDIKATYSPPFKMFFSFLFMVAIYSFIKSIFKLPPQMSSSIIVLIIVLVIKFIVVMCFTPLSGLIIVFYFIIYSLLSFVIFNNYDVLGGMKMVRDSIFRIEYAEALADKNGACKDNLYKCKNQSFYEIFVSFCKDSFLLKYVYIIEVLLVMSLLASINDYITKIESPDLKAGMVVLSVLMIGAIVALAIYRNSLTLISSILPKSSMEYMQVYTKNINEAAATGKQPCPTVKLKE